MPGQRLRNSGTGQRIRFIKVAERDIDKVEEERAGPRRGLLRQW